MHSDVPTTSHSAALIYSDTLTPLTTLFTDSTHAEQGVEFKECY